MNSKWISTACLLGFLSVVLGAFATHSLRNILSDEAMKIFHTAAQYQIFHSLALLGYGLWSERNPARASNYIGLSFLFGILFFSGSLYLLALTGKTFFGAITPIGGLLLMLGWLQFARASFKS